jgi:hypothetical protein
MSYNEGEEIVETEPSNLEDKKRDTIPCSVDSKVQDLMKLIFDMKMMNSQMK